MVLPREAVDAPFLEVLETGLDEALGNLTSWVASQPVACLELGCP